MSVAENSVASSPEAETATDWVRPFPSVHSVEARPSASVTAVSRLTEPLASPGENETDTPGTPLPPSSSTRATSGCGRGCPPIPSWWFPETALNRAGRCSTVTSASAERPPAAPVTLAVPFPAAVTRPSLVTLATEASLLAQVTVTPVMSWPRWSRTVAVRRTVSPRDRSVTVAGEMVTVVGTEGGGGGGGATGSSPPPQEASRTATAQMRPGGADRAMRAFTSACVRAGRN